MQFSKLAIALPLVAAASAFQPAPASARTKTILKYGAIYLGARAIYNAGQRSAYHPHHYAPYQRYYTGYYCHPAPVHRYW